MKRTKEDADVTRQHLLQSALRVFSDKGFAATRLEDIAKAADVTRGAIYHHFGNKQELFIALFKERMDPVFDIMTQILAENINPLERIRKLLNVMFDKTINDMDFNASQQLDLMDHKIKQELPALREWVNNRAQNLIRMIVQLIASGKESGHINKNLDAEAVAFSIISFITGFGFVIRSEDDRFPVAAKRKQMIDIFINGVKA